MLYADVGKYQHGSQANFSVKEYFEVNNVINSTMEIYRDLLGLKFEKVEM